MIIKKLLLILLCLPMIGFGQQIPCDTSVSINIDTQNSNEAIYSVSGINLFPNQFSFSWVYFNMAGMCIGGGAYNSPSDTVNLSNNLPDSTEIWCMIIDSLGSCIVKDTLVYDFSAGWFLISNPSAISLGCTDSTAFNYDSLATINDSSCVYCDLIIDSLLVTQLTCFNYNNASVDIIATGTQPLPYNYYVVRLNPTDTVLQGNIGFTNGLSPGVYVAVVVDSLGCLDSDTFEIHHLDSIRIDSITAINSSCNGYNDGYVQNIFASGGTHPYMYQFNGGGFYSSWLCNISPSCPTGYVFTNLAPGWYSIEIYDSLGCASSIWFEITEPPLIILQQANSICDGDNVIVGNSVYATTGNYTDTLTAANGCDSIVYTNIVVDQNTSSYDTLSVSTSIVWNGMPLNVSGDYSVTLMNSLGCDSIANLNLTVTTTGISDIVNSKSNLVKITDVLGKETPYRRNTPLFYIYNDGTVEKRIVIE